MQCQSQKMWAVLPDNDESLALQFYYQYFKVFVHFQIGSTIYIYFNVLLLYLTD